ARPGESPRRLAAVVRRGAAPRGRAPRGLVVRAGADDLVGGRDALRMAGDGLEERRPLECQEIHVGRRDPRGGPRKLAQARHPPVEGERTSAGTSAPDTINAVRMPKAATRAAAPTEPSASASIPRPSRTPNTRASASSGAIRWRSVRAETSLRLRPAPPKPR